MIINQVKTYTMELTVEEFELFHPICKEVGYNYRFNAKEEIYNMIVTDEMLFEMKYLLEQERDYQYYEECNRFRAKEIDYLINEVAYEVRNGY